MFISMQGNWTVSVKSKSAAFDQRFIVSGATTGNGTYAGTVGMTAHVTGKQWSIAIQNNPGTGFRLSKAQIKFPQKIGGQYVLDIGSEDAGDNDFNDMVLTCKSTASINDFMIYGNVRLYSGRCLFNPCYRFPFVIDTYPGLLEALKNPKLKDILEKLYPERIPIPFPNPPDPGPFKPIVLDLTGEATQPRLAQVFQRNTVQDKAADLKAVDVKAAKPRAAADASFEAASVASAGSAASALALADFTPVKTLAAKSIAAASRFTQVEQVSIAKIIDGLFLGCSTEAGSNLTLTFEEYDRTSAELAGGAYTGTGNRQVLGDAITDIFGNYIFRFTFDMTFPGIADSTDIAGGEDINVVAYPDIIAKVIGFSPYTVLYESAPFYNVSNLKRIDLCLPKSAVQPTSVCFNGNLVGSLGNVFIGGNQNTLALTTAAALRRYGYGNDLEADGKISVHSSLAQFSVDCAAWSGVIDMRGCMYDAAKPANQNLIKWYTIRIRRQGTANWIFVSQNYKHPKHSNRLLPNYIGDDVGPFSVNLHVNGAAVATPTPAYINIQREIFAEGVDWVFAELDRYMQLNTGLYDLIAGEISPGTFYVRVDGYDASGQPVPGATDLIPLYIHNRPLNFQLTAPVLADPSIVNAGCGLLRLTPAQLNVPMQFSFKANDPYGFVDSFALSMSRCPAPMLALQVNSPNPPLSHTPAGAGILSQGQAATATPANLPHGCPGYTGTLAEFSEAGLVAVAFQPAASEGGWIKPEEYFTVLHFSLTAHKRVTNGYNTGLSSLYHTSHSISLERLTP